MDGLRAKALKEREELRERLAELDAFLAVYDRLVASEPPQVESMTSVEKSEQVGTQAERRRDIGAPARLADAAEEAIREANTPLTRGQLVERLEAKGIEISSPDKPRYLGTILWRQKDRFRNIEGEGYWLEGVPLPNPKEPHFSVFQ